VKKIDGEWLRLWSPLYRPFWHPQHLYPLVKVTAIFKKMKFESLNLVQICEGERKCACIPHLLRALVLMVDFQTGPERWPCHDALKRAEWTDWMLRVFRLSSAIVKARTEPWITFTSSQSEINRIFTVMTTLTEIRLPVHWADEINRKIL
jgi:hypothetical protein